MLNMPHHVVKEQQMHPTGSAEMNRERIRFILTVSFVQLKCITVGWCRKSHSQDTELVCVCQRNLTQLCQGYSPHHATGLMSFLSFFETWYRPIPMPNVIFCARDVPIIVLFLVCVIANCPGISPHVRHFGFLLKLPGIFQMKLAN